MKFLLDGPFDTFPSIEVTLYRGSSQTGGKVDFNAKDNEEFLRSINAEVVCGPLDLGTHIDLSGGSGTVVMTSPELLLKKARNLFLFIKAKGKLEDTPSTSSSQKTSPVVLNQSTLSFVLHQSVSIFQFQFCVSFSSDNYLGDFIKEVSPAGRIQRSVAVQRA